MTKLQVFWRAVFLIGFSVIGGECQALNAHINPAWVESGRQLLASQGYQQSLQGYQRGLQDYQQRPLLARDGLQGYRHGATSTREQPQGYSPTQQTSLFYLDNTGRLRPVYVDSRVPSSLTDLTNYRSQFGNNGVNSRSDVYQVEPYYT